MGGKRREDKVRTVIHCACRSQQEAYGNSEAIKDLWSVLPKAIELQSPPTDLLRGNPHRLMLTDATTVAFPEIKWALCKAMLLMHPNLSAMFVSMLRIMLSQWPCTWEPLGFSCRHPNVTEAGYSAFRRAILAAYETIRDFYPAVEGRYFILFTGHKSLTYSLLLSGPLLTTRDQVLLLFLSFRRTFVTYSLAGGYPANNSMALRIPP